MGNLFKAIWNPYVENYQLTYLRGIPPKSILLIMKSGEESLSFSSTNNSHNYNNVSVMAIQNFCSGVSSVHPVVGGRATVVI